MPTDKHPKPPEYLTDEALLEWHRVIAELDAAGLLEQTDRSIIALYCRTYGQYADAMRGVDAHGIVIKYSSNVGASPFYKAAKELAAQLRALLNDLGLTPAARAKAGKEGCPRASDMLMPVFPCHHHACTEHVARRGDVCAQHAGTTRTARQVIQHHYDQHVRDQDAKAFYNSKPWQLARAAKLGECPFCERCRSEWAEHVHHRLPLKRCAPPEKTAQANLMSLCPGCHTTIETTPAERDAITAAYLAAHQRKAAPCSS